MPNQPPHTAPMPKPQLVSLASEHSVNSPKPQIVFFASFLKDGKQAAALGYKNPESVKFFGALEFFVETAGRQGFILQDRGKNPWLAGVSQREQSSTHELQNHYWAGVSADLSNWNTPYTFSGKEKDEETGYSYFGARYYDSDLSVWLSVDPMSDRLPFISPYSYCYNHPVNYKDPDGKFPWLAGIIGGAINIGIQYSISKWQDEEYDFKKEALGDFANGFLVASGGGVIAKLGLTITKAAVYTAVNLGLASGFDESIDHCFAGEADIKRVFEESVWGLATGMAGGEYSKKTVNFLNKIADKKVKELSKRELNSYLRIQEKIFTKELKNKGYKTSGKEFKRQLGTRLQNSEEVKLAEINFWKGTAEKTASGGVQISIDYIGTVGKDKLEKIK